MRHTFGCEFKIRDFGTDIILDGDENLLNVYKNNIKIRDSIFLDRPLHFQYYGSFAQCEGLLCI
jgi:hypothetical protein